MIQQLRAILEEYFEDMWYGNFYKEIVNEASEITITVNLPYIYELAVDRLYDPCNKSYVWVPFGEDPLWNSVEI